MKKCNKCLIKFTGDLERCPLCKEELTGEATPSIFPKLHNKKSRLLYKVLFFVSFSVGVLFTFLEYTITKSFTISKYVILGLINNYILIRFILNNYKNVLKMINRYFKLILILIFLWYIMTKSLIITTYIIPIMCIIILVFNCISMIILKDKYIIKYAKTITLDCIISLLPLLLVMFKLSIFALLSYICTIIDLLVFVGLIVFCKDHIIEEIKKIFNF